MSTGTTRLSPRARRVGLALIPVAVLAVAALAEGALRAYHVFVARREIASLPPVERRAIVPSPDPELIFAFRPGHDDGGFRVNAWGMPDDEVSKAPPAATFRIAFVGDSVSANFQLRPRDEIYLEILERRLDRAGADDLRVECLNFGVNGYGADQLAHVVRSRVPEFRPDVIVVQFSLNDPYPSDSPYGRRAPNGFRLAALVRRLLWPERGLAVFHVERNWDDAGFASVRRGIAEIAASARESGIPTLGVLFPYLDARAYDAWGFTRYHEAMRRAAADEGLPWLDLYETFREAGRIAPADPPDVLHPDADGHRLAAARIESELRARGWLPALASGEGSPDTPGP